MDMPEIMDLIVWPVDNFCTLENVKSNLLTIRLLQIRLEKSLAN